MLAIEVTIFMKHKCCFKVIQDKIVFSQSLPLKE